MIYFHTCTQFSRHSKHVLNITEDLLRYERAGETTTQTYLGNLPMSMPLLEDRVGAKNHQGE